MSRSPRAGVAASVSMRVALTPDEAGVIDDARGGIARSDWLRSAGLREARRVGAGLPPTAAELPPPSDPRAAEREMERRLDAALAEEPRRSDPVIARDLHTALATPDWAWRYGDLPGEEETPTGAMEDAA